MRFSQCRDQAAEMCTRRTLFEKMCCKSQEITRQIFVLFLQCEFVTFGTELIRG